MAQPLEFGPTEPSGPTPTWRIVLIAAVVALIVGAIPALAGALIYADNLDDASKGRSQDNCKLSAEGRENANRRVVIQWKETQSDIKVYQRLLKNIPEGSETYKIISDGLKLKQDNIKELTISPPPNCDDLGEGDFKLADPIPLNEQTVKDFEDGKVR